VTSRFLWREEGKEIAGSIGLHIKDEIYRSISSPISSFWSTKMCLMSPGTTLLCVFSILVALCGGLNLEDAGK